MMATWQPQYGFYGLHGFLGIVLGLVLLIVVVWGLWSIFDIVKAKFSNESTAWLFQILRVVLIVVTVVWFANRIFNLMWF